MQEAICTFSFSPHFDLRKAVSELVTRLRPFLYWGQHRTIASARFGGSFPPILRFETFEIHKVFLHVSNLDLAKNLSPNLLAELRGVALKNSKGCSPSGCTLFVWLRFLFHPRQVGERVAAEVIGDRPVEPLPQGQRPAIFRVFALLPGLEAGDGGQRALGQR